MNVEIHSTKYPQVLADVIPNDPAHQKFALTHPDGARNAIWYRRTPKIRPIECNAPHYDGEGNYIEHRQDKATAPHVDPQPKDMYDYKKLRNANKNRPRQQKHYQKEEREISIDIPRP